MRSERNYGIKINYLSLSMIERYLSLSMETKLLRGFEEKLLLQSQQVLCPMQFFKSHLAFLDRKGSVCFVFLQILMKVTLESYTKNLCSGEAQPPLSERAAYTGGLSQRMGSFQEVNSNMGKERKSHLGNRSCLCPSLLVKCSQSQKGQPVMPTLLSKFGKPWCSSHVCSRCK